jgi:hypothetical protein
MGKTLSRWLKEAISRHVFNAGGGGGAGRFDFHARNWYVKLLRETTGVNTQ